MSGVSEIIGVVSGVIGIVQFLAGTFTPQETPEHAAFRVKVGLDGSSGLSNAGGDVEVIRIFNQNGEIIGSGNGNSVASGGFSDFQIRQINNQQAVHMTLVAGDDALCIASVTATLAEQSQYGWTGDWGCLCGQKWYWSNVFADDRDAPLLCTWLDKNHSGDLRAGVLKVHWPSLLKTGGGELETNPAAYCGPAVVFLENEDGQDITSTAPSEECKQSVPTDRRDLAGVGGPPAIRASVQSPARAKDQDSRLVVSSLNAHSAWGLCTATNSWGPDFVSLTEGRYCNMVTREVLPLCQGAEQQDCFALGGHNGTHIKKRDGTTEAQSYSAIIHW